MEKKSFDSFYQDNKIACIVYGISACLIVFSSLCMILFNDVPARMEFGSAIMNANYKDMTTDDGREDDLSGFFDEEIQQKADKALEESKSDSAANEEEVVPEDAANTENTNAQPEATTTDPNATNNNTTATPSNN